MSTRLRRGAALSALFTCTILGTASLHAQEGGWLGADVGGPALAGSATKQQDGLWRIDGSGHDIWSESDQFHFLYRTIYGDGQITAKVTSLRGADVWSKAGVMIREALSSGARHAFTLVSAEAGVAFQRRITAGHPTEHTAGWGAAAPVWVRLARVGSRFSAYQSADGQSWSLIGEEHIPMQEEVHVGLAVTSHAEGVFASGVFSDITVASASGGTTLPSPSEPSPTPPPDHAAGPTLPEPWATADVGAPALPGSAAESGGTFLLLAAGADIWDRSDQFRYVYQRVIGDVEVVARVATLTYADQWSKGGVMIRDSLDASASHAIVAATPGSGWTFQRRPHSGGDSAATAGPGGTAPGWVRLVRRGSVITSYVSADGVNWTLVGSETIAMGPAAYVGLALTSHNAGQAATAVFDGVRVGAPVESTQPQPGGNAVPTVGLISPSPGSSYPASATIALEAAASDSDGSVTRVEFYANGALIGAATGSPYVFTWTNVPAGTYALTAKAYDDDGAVATSSGLSVTVANAPPQLARLAFTQSSDARTTVSYYVVGFYRASGDGVQVAQMDLGMPDGTVRDVEFDVSAVVNTLPPGAYYAIVTAIGPGGVTSSDPSPTFTR